MLPRSLALTGAVLLCGCSNQPNPSLPSGATAAPARGVEGIRVVRTWSDLRASAPIQLTSGARVRLGVEATEAPAGSGVLLYCLVDDMARGAASDLGPLQVTTGPEEKERLEKLKRSVALYRRGALLFARTISLPDPGPVRVQVRDPEGAVLLRLTLRGGEERFHAWVPWSHPVRRSIEKGGRMAVSNGQRAPALPRWEGDQPLTPPADPHAPLPTLFPERPELDLSYDGRTLRLSGGDLRGADPYRHHLVRWWVNGRPWSPLRRREEMVRAVMELARREQEVELALRPMLLGARPGDLVELQLLHCPTGWTLADRRLRLKRLRILRHGTPRTRLSNRVGLVVQAPVPPVVREADSE